MLRTKPVIYASAALLMAAGLSGPASAQSILAQIYALLTPGVVGNVAQVGIGATRVGSTNGLIGGSGTPTTVVGVNVASGTNQACGSVATANILQNGSLISAGC